ncbi:MAG: VCBS repeat-containing protein [Planctomycetes bacterium]|nr:VCBS repeat-containing protein [Planctomycetota bacterium]
MCNGCKCCGGRPADPGPGHLVLVCEGEPDIVVAAGGALVVARNGGLNPLGNPQFTTATPLVSGTTMLFRSVAVFRNDRTGQFAAPSIVATTHDAPGRVAVGDLDGDGRADVVVPHAKDKGVSVFFAKQDASATLDSPSFRAVDFSPVSIHLADVTGDGNPDVVMSGYEFEPATGTNRVSVLFEENVADIVTRFGAFGVGTKLSISTLTGLGPSAFKSDVVVADVNGDGTPEFVVANYFDAAATVVYVDVVKPGGGNILTLNGSGVKPR